MPLTQAAQRAADTKIEAAGQAIAMDIYKRLEIVMADFKIPGEQPICRDQTIDNVAMGLARCDVEVIEANAVMATAQAHSARIARQIETLEGERRAIVRRRAGGDQRP